MSGVRWGLLVVGVSLLSGCSAAVDTLGADPRGAPQGVEVAGSRSLGGAATSTTQVAAPTTAPAPIPTSTAPSRAEPIVAAAPPTAPATTDAPTTTLDPAYGIHDPRCVVVVGPGDTLAYIAETFDDETVDPAALIAENSLGDGTIETGELLDVCVDNGLDDITGAERIERNPAVVEAEVRRGVEAQQEHLNALFGGYGIDELLVDGISGPVTRQRICAWRLAVGLPPSLADLEPGSEEEQQLYATASLPVPTTTAVASQRWILIDRTCQVMFVGSGAERLEFVFPTSTGEPGYETRDQDRTPVFRYNAADHNGGWHNSTSYPVAADNPLNGNMYRPLYFDRGQAIHGANNVPRSPRSKGCARLRVHHQDALLAWLGLAGSGSTTNVGRIGVTVNVQGAWG